MRVEMGVMDSLDRKDRPGETDNQEVMVHLDLMGDPADKALMDLLDSQVLRVIREPLALPVSGVTRERVESLVSLD